jgi:DNA-binding Xre family transcriptional regulator
MNETDTAKRAGISREIVSLAKRGRSIGPATLGKIAKALGVDPTEIIEKDDE